MLNCKQQTETTVHFHFNMERKSWRKKKIESSENVENQVPIIATAVLVPDLLQFIDSLSGNAALFRHRNIESRENLQLSMDSENDDDPVDRKEKSRKCYRSTAIGTVSSCASLTHIFASSLFLPFSFHVFLFLSGSRRAHRLMFSTSRSMMLYCAFFT